MKSTIYYHERYKSYGRFPDPERTPVKCFFIHTTSQGDFNKLTYSAKKKESTRNEFSKQVYFIPRPDADDKAIERELKRGKEFFTPKDGFLFGAFYELTKLGEIININV